VTQQNQQVAAAAIVEDQAWLGELQEELRAAIAPVFAQARSRGATSDDTALTLLVARHLADRDGDGDPAAFLADLAGQEPAIRGLGPTTTAAIERFRRGDQAAGSPGRATNGAAMRAFPIGWVLAHDQAERRRQVTIAMSGPPTPTPPLWSRRA
jgi:ADP-ribosylglycohydrolase